MKSHIQITSLILRRFRDNTSKKRIYYYDLKEKKLSYKTVKNVGAIKNYYFSEVEEELNRSVENDMGKLLLRIISNLDNNNGFEISKDDVDTIIDFLFINHIRSKESLNIFNDNSYTAFLFDDKVNHNYLVGHSLNPKNLQIFRNSFPFHKASILINETSVPYITTRNGTARIKFNNIYYEYLPITPKYAIALGNYENKDPIMYFFNNESEIKILNNKMIETEVRTNNDFIVSNDEVTINNIILNLNESQ